MVFFFNICCKFQQVISIFFEFIGYCRGNMGGNGPNKNAKKVPFTCQGNKAFMFLSCSK